MADYMIASSCQYWNGKQDEEYCVEQVISFQQQTNMEKVFEEVVYPEELTLKKMDHVAVTVSDKTGHTFQPDYEDHIKSFRNLIPNWNLSPLLFIETWKMRMSIIIYIHRRRFSKFVQ